jgi:deoxyribodipyrimidine photolyase-related protein
VSPTALVLGDQLHPGNPALADAGRVVLVESLAGMRRRPLHRRRAHLVLSGMRHLAADLRERGVEVVEHRGAASLREALTAHRGEELVCAEPAEPRAGRALAALGVRTLPDTRFLTTPEAFAAWAAGRRRLMMEGFYREQRRRLGLLLDADGGPEGGRWNLDAENRSRPPAGLHAPEPWRPREDEIDAGVRADLDRWELPLWGEDGPRRFAVTPAEAQTALEDFVAHRLAQFGRWQDAMVPGEPFLFHSLLSVPLNLGVLEPLAAARAAEAAYRAGAVPLASAEGFIRQVVGWREYVWGMYRLRADEWPRDDALEARRPLPAAFWGERVGWACLDGVVDGVRREAYAHHIERLMVLGNIALLAEAEPWETVRWFQGVFADGAEWVMAPNAAGMALHADGGVTMTKPYAAGGNYISKMSNPSWCSSCRYDPRRRTGEDACPVTALYWAFIARHRERLAANPRTAMPVRTWERFGAGEQAAIAERAERARAELARSS